jgi:hypothetical protein
MQLYIAETLANNQQEQHKIKNYHQFYLLLHKKKMILEQEQKFKEVLSKIEGKINEQSFFNKFLELYPAAWKKHKITFSKFTRSKQFGKTIPLPKPEVSLRNEIRVWLKKQ